MSCLPDRARMFCMRILLVIIMLALARAADAQVLGYAVAGPAGFQGFFGSSVSGGQAAGGAELLFRGRVGLGGEYGVIVNQSSGLLVWSINGVVHVLSGRGSSNVSPFVTGGYTRLSSGEGAFNAWNAGAGLDIWAKPRVGVRVELRDQVRPDHRGDVHYWTMRAGVVFR
jgi:hypothetical protein